MLLYSTVFINLILHLQAETTTAFSNSTHNTSKNQTIRHGEYLLSKCIKNADVDAHTAFMTAKRSLQTCMHSKIPAHFWEHFQEPTNIKLLCSETRENVHDCIKDVLDKMAVCLPQEEQYLKTVLLNWFDDAAKYMCLDDAAVLTEYLKIVNDKENRRYFRGSAFVVSACFGEEFPKDAFDLGDEIIEENDFCGYMNKTKSCIVEHLTNDSRLPTFLGKVINTVADLGTSSCSTNNTLV